MLLFGIDGPISAQNVEYVPLTLPVTGPPQAVDDQYSMTEDGTLDVAEADGVLDNDQDDEGDPLRAVLAMGPQHGTLALRDDGSFRYTPARISSGWTISPIAPTTDATIP